MTNAEQQARQEEWRQKIAAYNASDQSVTEWCSTQGIEKKMFYYWTKKLRQQSEGSSSASTSEWLPVMLSDRLPSGQGSHLFVRIGKATIEIHPGFDRDLLTEAVRVLAAVC